MPSVETRFSWIAAQEDGTEHAVTDEEHVAGMEAGDGVFEPLCGHVFRAACMDAAPLRRCRSCVAVLRARATTRRADQRPNRPGWLSRLCDRGAHRSPLVWRRPPTQSGATS